MKKDTSINSLTHLLYLCSIGVLVALSSVSSVRAGGKVVMFDAKTTARQSIKAIHGASWELNAKGDALRVHSVVTAKQSGVRIDGEWNLSSCNRLVLEVENLNQIEYLPVTIHLEQSDGSLSRLEGVYLERLYAPESKISKFVLDLPAKLPYPQMRELFKGMRRDPYCQWGSASDIDLSRVASVNVYVNRPRENWDWELRSVVALEGMPNQPYSWQTMNRDEFFPFIDRYGQFMHNHWKGKTHSDEDLAQAYREELKDLDSHPAPKGRTKFGGWADGPKLRATGHFRVEKVDGKWWLVDPEGYLFWSHGVVRVTPSSSITPLDNREFYFADLPVQGSEYAEFYTTRDELLYPYYVARNIKKTYDFSAANIKRKYGAKWREKYADMAHRRLSSWGLNTIANSSDKSICMQDRTPYTDRIELDSPVLESSKGVWWKFKDPFHSEFRTSLRRQLIERLAELEDPWCLGFFVDNEIDWGTASTLGEWTLQSPAEQAAKVEMIRLLKLKYGQIEKLNYAWGTSHADWSALSISVDKPTKGSMSDCVEFSVAMTEAYFKNVSEVFREVAPYKLYMGCRFARSNENVIRIGAKYCDVVSYNIYKMNLKGFALPSQMDKPVMIGEFHFGALDRGMFHPGLVKTASQSVRAECYANYVESALCHPNIIGTHWHQFSDQATTGRFDGENFQVGFVDVCDRPYPETVAKIREVGYKMYKIRGGK